MLLLLTVDVLVLFYSLLMVHLWNTPHVVTELSHLVLVGDFGWKVYVSLPDDVKTLVCKEIGKRGPVVYPSTNRRPFIRGKCVIPLSMLVDALKSAEVDQIVVYADGMKCPGGFPSLRHDDPKKPYISVSVGLWH